MNSEKQRRNLIAKEAVKKMLFNICGEEIDESDPEIREGLEIMADTFRQMAEEKLAEKARN